MSLKKLLGKRIQEIRLNKNLKQDSLTKKVNLDTSSISNIETGKTYPAPENLEKLAIALGVKPKNLYDFDHHQEIENLEQEIIKIFQSQTQENQRLLYKIVKSFEK